VRPRRFRTTVGAADARRPLVALVGRPNVGKSSLFNRLVGGRPALVEDMPGVTRDRRYGIAEWTRARFRVVDTGGLDPSADGVLGAMRAQTLRAVEEADVLVFVLDVAEGVTGVDESVSQLLRRSNKPVIVAANKVDSEKREQALGDVYKLGWRDVFAISASHGRGVGDLLDRLVECLGPGAAVADLEDSEDVEADEPTEPRHGDDGEETTETTDVEDPPGGAIGGGDGPEADHDDDDDGEVDVDTDRLDTDVRETPDGEKVVRERPVDSGPIRMAFVGKPNAGKSSLVNRLLGEERVLVHELPGTTRDPIDTPFTYGGQTFVLVDTAGMRRKRAIDTLTEAVAAKMAEDQLAGCDVAVLVIDAGIGATTEDARLGGLIEDSGRAAVVVLNKKDAVPRAALDATLEKARETLPFLSWAPMLTTSALTGAGVGELPSVVAQAFAQASRRISTGEVNRFLEAVLADKPPPAAAGGRHVRLYFATQASVRPPTFVVSTNHPALVPFSYRRFLANQLRKAYGFKGTPLRIVLRAHKRKRAGGAPAAP
jgi:GTP-binding protein